MAEAKRLSLYIEATTRAIKYEEKARESPNTILKQCVRVNRSMANNSKIKQDRTEQKH